MSDEPRISKDVDKKIYDIAREHWRKAKDAGQEKAEELRTLVSGQLDDGSPNSFMVKIRPNPINARLSTGWKVVVEDRVWEIPQAELEKSRLL